MLDKLSDNKGLNSWVSLGKNKGRLKIVMDNSQLKLNAEEVYGEGKNDHKIINVALSLKKSGQFAWVAK